MAESLRDGWGRRAWRLLGSMPFAVAILAIVAIGASVGSLVEQSQPSARYVGQVGELWAQLYRLVGLDDVYHSPWFLGLLGLMTTSTALCVWRQTPNMWREARSHRAHLSASQLKGAWAVHVELDVREPAQRWRPALFGLLARDRFHCAVGDASAGSFSVSARKGMARRLGYVLTHLGIVVVGVGGLVDGNLGVQWARLSGELRPASFGVDAAASDERSWLGEDSGAFRGALRLAPGEAGDAVAISAGDGQLMRRLPVQVRLESFRIELHPNGQPRDFVSEIRVKEHGAGEETPLRVSMNRPARYKDLNFYQSGFDDGGTRVAARILGQGGLDTQAVQAQVGVGVPVLLDGQAWRLEPMTWHPRNVLPLEPGRASSLGQAFLEGSRTATTQDFGPSLDLAWRDGAGQARQQTVWQQPIPVEGKDYLVTAVALADEQDRAYLRLPLDRDGSLDGYRAILDAWRQPARREALVARATAALGDDAAARQLRDGLSAACARFLDGGFAALDAPDDGLDEASRARARQTVVELLTRIAMDAWQSRELERNRTRRGLSAHEADDAARLVEDTLLGYDHWIRLGRPPLLQIEQAVPVEATVLQVTQAPGALVVYAGMGMLALGVVLMFLVPERRLWLRRLDNGRMLIAMAAHRPMPGLDLELEALADRIAPVLGADPRHHSSGARND